MVSGFGGGLGRSVVGQAVIQIITDSSRAERQLTALQRNLAIGTVAGFAAATVAATGFETRMVRIENLVGVNRDTLRAWQADILGLADATGRGPNELAEALFVVTSAGERGAEALRILEEAAKGSAIGLGDTASIARVVTAAIQAWGSESLSASRATNILAATVREGNLEAASLSGSLGRVLGVASSVGVTFESVGAFIATFSRLGVNAEEATTALRSILNLMIKPTEQAGQALAGVGLSMEELRRIAVDEGLPQALNLLVESFRGNEEALALVIPNVRALSGVLGTSGAQAEEFARIQRVISGELDIVNEGMERVRETAEFQFRRALANAQVVLISLGSIVLPTAATALAGLAEGLTIAADAWQTLPGPIQAAVLGFTAVVTLGPVVVLVVAKITAALVAARIATVGFTAALLTNPITLAAVATAAALAALSLRGQASAARDAAAAARELQGIELSSASVDQLALSVEVTRAYRDELEEQVEALRAVVQAHSVYLRSRADEVEQLSALERMLEHVNNELSTHEQALGLAVVAQDRQAAAADEAARSNAELAERMADAEREARDLSATGIAAAFALELMSAAADELIDGFDVVGLRIEAAVQRIRAAFEDELQLREIVETLFTLADPTRALRDELDGVAAAEVDVARGADRAQESIGDLAGAMERARSGAAALLTDFSNLVVSGLRRQAEGSLEAQRALIEAQRTILQAAAQERLRILERERDAAIRLIDEQLAARVSALDAELALLDAGDFEQELGRIDRALALAFDPRDRARIEEDRARLLRRERREEIRSEISAAEETAAGRRGALEGQLEARRATEAAGVRVALDALALEERGAEEAFAAITDEFALASAARELILAGELAQMSQLLDGFVPEWRTFGLSAGEALLEGLQPSLDAIVARTQSTLSAFGGGPGGTAAPSGFGAQAQLEQIERLRSGGAPEFVTSALRDNFEEMFGFLAPLASGGLVTRPTIGLLGESGPEIVSPVSTLRDLLQESEGGRSVDVRVFIGDVELRSLVRVEVDGETTRQLTRGAKLAGG